MHLFSHTCHDMHHYRHTTTTQIPSRILAMGSPFCPAATLADRVGAHDFFLVDNQRITKKMQKKSLSLLRI